MVQSSDESEPESPKQEEEEEEEVEQAIPVTEVDYSLYREVAIEALSKLLVLKGCDRSLLEEIVSKAPCATLPPNQEIVICDDSPMLIVLSGVLNVCVGCSPEADIGPGNVLNHAGMLGLHEVAVPFKPGPGKARNAEESVRLLEASTEAAVPSVLKTEAVNVQNLCPHHAQMTMASAHEKGGQSPQKPPSGWLRMEAKAGENRTAGHDTAVALITFDLVEQVLGTTDFAIQFKENLSHMLDKFKSILRHAIFPSVPPEVIWHLAGMTEYRYFEVGEMMVEEDDFGEHADVLYAVDSGKADVLKLVSLAGEDPLPQVVGHLQPGAIIGDITYIKCNLPRGASVRVTEAVRAISIHPTAVLDVLARFPGMIACFQGRLRDTVMLLQNSLPRPAEAMKGIYLFSHCDAAFLRAVGNICERKVYFAGDMIRHAGMNDDNLRLIEFGMARIEKDCCRCVGFGEAGTLLGERRFFKTQELRQQEVRLRVATPLALILFIPRQAFFSVLDSYPSEQKRFREHSSDAGSVKRDHDAANLPILRTCGPGFISSIAPGIRSITFKPGQTIIVQAAVDTGSMFIIKGGKADITVNERVVKQVATGDSFGELAILGFVKRRSACVRATTLCMCLEMPRAAFLAALEAHPEEQEHFQQLGRQHGVKVLSVQWPMFAGGAERLHSLANLYARRQITAKGKWATCNDEPLPEDCAVLVLRGEIKHLEGAKEKMLTEFSCFGEQVLIDLPRSQGRLVPQTNCEVQIMTKEIFQRILAECPEERDFVLQRTVDELAQKAQQELGIPKGSPGVLKFSAVFRVGSNEFRDALLRRLEARIVHPGQAIVESGSVDERMFILVKGTASNEGGGSCQGDDVTVCERCVCGESMVLGTARMHINTVRATTMCIVQTLTRESMDEVLVDFPQELEMYSRLRRSMGDLAELTTMEQMRQSYAFAEADPVFMQMACERADEVYYAPSEDIIKRGDTCKAGETSMYVILTGSATAEGEFGDELGKLSRLDLIGEGGCLGLAETRGAAVRNAKTSIALVLRLHGAAVERAARAFPDMIDNIVKICRQRSAANEEVGRARQAWKEDFVMPALLACRIFADFSRETVDKIADHLQQVTYTSGQCICQVGHSAESMIVLLSGEAVIMTKSGDTVGFLTEGAVIGEVAVLGLFPWRTATIRATCRTNVVLVPASLIWKVLKADPDSTAQKAFARLEEERREQVDRGMPMCALPLSVTVRDVVARVVALHADRFDLPPDATAKPQSQSRGPHFYIFVRGTANLMIGSRHIMVVSPGSLPILPEALLHEYGAEIVASTACEAYRVSHGDILLATHSVRTKWFKGFEALIDDAHVKVRSKLQAARSIIDMSKKRRPGSSIGSVYSLDLGSDLAPSILQGNCSEYTWSWQGSPSKSLRGRSKCSLTSSCVKFPAIDAAPNKACQRMGSVRSRSNPAQRGRTADGEMGFRGLDEEPLMKTHTMMSRPKSTAKLP
eukprot:TRINITY_DN5274_c0_g1_i1.p1 TRINITY_DN5274_c0_g1~~TRINITY_DN5274_c0_g1_i1.p1  ORF type:complete len:1478 (-),score=279.90 TRINITY_DN5274_c0_g1_i1:139-4572(-)